MATKTNAAGYDPIKYGTKGEQTGIAKVGQARNQPGFVPRGQRGGEPADERPAGTAGTNYLTPKQQAKVDEFLGAAYDPTKPLNTQLFRAQWQSMNQEERRAYAKAKAGLWLEGGPTSKTLSGFHSEYIQALGEQNAQREQNLKFRLANYEQEGGGWSTTPTEGKAFLEYWKTFAATPEGQAHIAQTGMTPEDWIASQTQDIKEGIKNYQQEQRQFGVIQSLAQSLGIDVPGFKPPGWASSLQGIQEGRGPLPSASMQAMYPGIVADIAGISPDLFQPGKAHTAASTATATETTANTEPGWQLYQGAFDTGYSEDQLQAEFI